MTPVAAQVATTHPAPTYRLLQFETCLSDGDCRVEGRIGTAVAGVASRIRQFKPAIVTVQEICQNQFNAVRAQINARWHMYGVFAPEGERSSGHCTDHRKGVAILSRRPLSAPHTLCLYNCATSITRADHKVVLCATTLLARYTKVCAVHLQPYGPASQVSALTHLVNSYSHHMPVIMAGDFNLGPANNLLDQIYATGGGGAHGVFQEASACTPRSTRTLTCNEITRAVGSSRLKLDYVFLTHQDFSAMTSYTGTSSFSDHRPLYTRFHACPTRTC